MHENRNLFLFLIEINNMHHTRHIGVISLTIGKQNYQEPGVEAELNFEFFESYHFIF